MESVSFQLPAGFKKLRNASVVLRELLTRHDAKNELVDDCERVLQGLLATIVEQSYGEDESRFIDVNLRVEGIKFYIETEDEGKFSNISLEKSLVLTSQDLHELHMPHYDIAVIKAFMDEIQYRYENGKNFWVLSKKIQHNEGVSPLSLNYEALG